MQQLGLNVETQSMDWARYLHARVALIRRCTQAGAVIAWAGPVYGHRNPASNIPLSGVKPNPAMESLRSQWFETPDFPAQRQLAERMQVLGLQDPPFIPLGQYFIPYAYRTGLTGFVLAPRRA
jgi:peptide/nickel transport system substrate-binding protein